MSTPTTVEDLFALFEARGGEHYGEDVTQLEHALQCAALARRDGATDELIIAALFHDIGHFIATTHDGSFDLAEHDDVHEALGARVLAPILGPTVARAVALHVTAKRWRCTIEPSYHDQLSAASQATLRAQGGLLNTEQCRRFEAHPGFESALALRSWDDEGKVVGLDVGELRDYEPAAQRLVRRLAVAR